ncbi:MAG TPA: hypothetical protein VIV06_00040 [Candidatus Limnocylindrales bacterium]
MRGRDQQRAGVLIRWIAGGLRSAQAVELLGVSERHAYLARALARDCVLWGLRQAPTTDSLVHNEVPWVTEPGRS